MKIGIIDRLLFDQESIIRALQQGIKYRPPTGYLKDFLIKKGAEVISAETIQGLAEHSTLSSYDAFLIHPGRDKQKETIERVQREAPNSLLAIITFNLDDYIPQNGAPVFSLDSRNYDKAYAFLESRLQERVKGSNRH
ncbi:hypothetical protein FJZ18_00880 [Candidatus Pacearchaeota archaeon]|nr:hypothetical protein [Candidatus Pacearchaeota archaeon]